LLRGALCSVARPLPASLARIGSSPCAWTLVNQWARLVIDELTRHRLVGQISPNKNMSPRCTTAAFTPSAEPQGFVIGCRLARRPGLLCDFCSSARTFALGLPSDKPSRACPCPRL